MSTPFQTCAYTKLNLVRPLSVPRRNKPSHLKAALQSEYPDAVKLRRYSELPKKGNAQGSSVISFSCPFRYAQHEIKRESYDEVVDLCSCIIPA